MAATKRMSVLRRYELPVDRFANEALPLYSDLLENHKKNMDQVLHFLLYNWIFNSSSDLII